MCKHVESEWVCRVSEWACVKYVKVSVCVCV